MSTRRVGPDVRVLCTTISLNAERGGGTAERTRHLARHMHALGVDCRVVAMEGGRHAEALAAAAVPVEVTGCVRLRYMLPRLDLVRLRRAVQEADIVHVLGYWNLLTVAVCRLARRVGTPYVLSGAGEFAALERPRLDQRLFHAGPARGLVADAASIVAITPLEREQIVRLLGVDPARVVVVPNGIDPPDVAATAGVAEPDLPLPSGRFVLFLGRLAHIKGPDLLLEAFAAIAPRFPDVSLVFAGPDFGLRGLLEERAAALGLAGRVTFAGYLDETARWIAYRRATVLAVPSRAEAMSLVALEAAAVGTPVLVTDQCGFDEVAQSGGGLVTTAEAAGLGRGLAALLDDPALVARGERLRAFALERYAWPKVAGQLVDHLGTLCRSGAARSA